MQCGEAQSLITAYLEKRLTLNQETELVRHIRGCRQCREELEFYLVVYVTTEMLDDKDIPDNDYSKAAERLLLATEQAAVRAQHHARTGRFRLITILLILGIALSLSVGRSAAEPETENTAMRTDGFYLGELSLPEEIDFVNNMIAAYDDAASDFVFSQRLRAAEVNRLWRSDVGLMRALRADGELTYTLPESFLLAEGSFAARLEKAKRPELMPQVTLTLKAFPHAGNGEVSQSVK